MAAVSVATGTAALGFVLAGRIFVCTFNPIRKVDTSALNDLTSSVSDFTSPVSSRTFCCNITCGGIPVSVMSLFPGGAKSRCNRCSMPAFLKRADTRTGCVGGNLDLRKSA
ncbi:hypothetical protein PF003_g5618 [Phytophthora fragariae]|nr:hypothetical protein PF003_g5618 [Phytophthora fragariae]